jgi:hypothetical protein
MGFSTFSSSFYHFEVFRKATESLKLYNLDEMTPIRKLFGLAPPPQLPPAPTQTGRVGNKNFFMKILQTFLYETDF